MTIPKKKPSTVAKKKVVKKKAAKKKTKKKVTKKRKARINATQKMFVDLLLHDPRRRATKAYMEAYGCTEKVAAASSSRMLRNVKVSEYLEKRQSEIEKKLRERYNITEDRILKEMSMLAFTRMGDVAHWDADRMTLFPSEELDEFVKAGVVEVSQTITQHGGSMKIKLADKGKPLETLGKHVGLFKDKLVIDADIETKKFMKEVFGSGRVKPAIAATA